MRDYVIMTDSCCDLTDQMARDLELEVLPLTMHMDGQDYPNDLAGTAISNQEFYKRIRAGKLATTSAVNVGQFQDAMRRVLEKLPAKRQTLMFSATMPPEIEKLADGMLVKPKTVKVDPVTSTVEALSAFTTKPSRPDSSCTVCAAASNVLDSEACLSPVMSMRSW